MTSMLFASMWLELRVPACHPERTLVILTTTRLSSFANAQDDKRVVVRMTQGSRFVSPCLMLQFVGNQCWSILHLKPLHVARAIAYNFIHSSRGHLFISIMTT